MNEQNVYTININLKKYIVFAVLFELLPKYNY